MNNNKGSLAGFTSQRSRLIIWGVIGLVLMSNLGAIIDSFLHPEIEYFDLEHIIVGGATALVFGIMFLMITRYLDRFEKTVSDISQSEKALRESEEKLKTIIETSPDGIATSTLDGKIQFVTEKLVSIFGYASTDELIGRNVMEFVHSSDREKIGLLINELLNGHLTGPAECLLVKKDGSLFYAEANANILCDAGKNPIGILYLERNITERKKAEALLRESEERYRLLHDSALDGIMLTAPDGRIFSANAAACHMLGRTEEEIMQAGRNGVVDTTDPNVALAIEERGRTGKFIGELTFIRKSGEKFPVELSSSLFTDRDDNTRTSLTFHDITERKQAEDKLRESEERYRFLTNNIPDIIYSLDGEGNIVTINSPAFEHYGYTEQDSKGKPFLNFIHPEDREIVIGSFLKALEEQRKFTQGLQFRIVAENGFSYWFELNSQARFDSQGQYKGEEGVLRDITERKQAEEKIRQLNATLEQHVEERTLELRDAQEQLVRHEKLSVLGQMASSVGHELRNPLAVMTSALYYLRLVQPNADEKIKQYLGMIEQEVRTSEKIISDLLDFARVKSVDREAVSVSDLICRTLERFPVPESVQSILDIPADLPQVYVDPRQMTQVLGNLVVNACQAMAPVRSGGKLSIIGNIQNNMIIIVVKDNGAGISPENMKKIFDPLFTTKVKGIGLGLAVSQKLVDANGGSIQVESEAGAGSAFTVSLPIHHPG